MKLGLKKIETSLYCVWCKMRLDILNRNLHRFSRRFQDIAEYRSHFRCSRGYVLHALVWGDHINSGLRNLVTKIVSISWTFIDVTYDWTDRQTGDRHSDSKCRAYLFCAAKNIDDDEANANCRTARRTFLQILYRSTTGLGIFSVMMP